MITNARVFKEKQKRCRNSAKNSTSRILVMTLFFIKNVDVTEKFRYTMLKFVKKTQFQL